MQTKIYNISIDKLQPFLKNHTEEEAIKDFLKEKNIHIEAFEFKKFKRTYRIYINLK